MTYNHDTRNNWITFMFVCKKRYNCFRKQSVIDSCTAGFKELEKFGFIFGKFGFGGTHTHFTVDVPKEYSPQNAETMLKDHSAKKIFAEHPRFRKRYPKNSFWSGYEHHEAKTEGIIRGHNPLISLYIENLSLVWVNIF